MSNKSNTILKYARENISPMWFILFVLFIYVVVRLIAWNNTVLLEGVDSLGYIRRIKLFLTFDLDDIINMSPDFTPFYLFFSALFALPGLPVETAARLCSFAFSIVLFLSVWGIGKRIESEENRFATILGLFLIAVSPALISLSFSVLSEPSYIATVYLGLWVFWSQYKNPTLGKAAILGLIFGLSFLNRLEGLIFLAVIPFFQLVHYVFSTERNYNFKKTLLWTGIFAGVYLLVIAPQVIRVSAIVGDFALNGRQIWSVAMSNNVNLYGLDFSPSEVNINYMKRNPEAWKSIVSDFELKKYVKLFTSNYRILSNDKFGELIGPILLAFFGIGFLSLLSSKRYFDLFFIITFISASLVPPMLHNVVIRHIAIIAPIILLVAGFGIAFLSSVITKSMKKRRYGREITSMALLVLITVSLLPFLWTSVINTKQANREYGPIELAEPTNIINKIKSDEPGRKPKIAAQYGFLAYFVDAEAYYLPRVSMDKFLVWAKLNKVDFLYINHRLMQPYPFLAEYIENGLPDNYTKLYTGADAHGNKTELYQILQPEI